MPLTVWNSAALLRVTTIICIVAPFLFADRSVSGQDSEVKPESGEKSAEPAWGTLTGKIIVEGEFPEIPDEVVDKDNEVCVVDGVMPKDDNLVIGDDGGLRDVFVMMYLKDDVEVPLHPSYIDSEPAAVTLDNARCRFVPHALAVRTGQKLILKNSDEVGHNCHIITFGNEENVNLPALSEIEIKLNSPDKVPGNVVCDIHKWMDAVILVRDEPYFASTGEDGSFTITNIPEGNWSFQFWHKKGGYLRKLQINGFEVGRRGEVELEFRNGETVDLGKMTIASEELDK